LSTRFLRLKKIAFIKCNSLTYTHNFAYISTVAKGNVPGKYLITGPDWKGEVPEGITEVIPCETQFLFAIHRTQLFNPDDLDNVKNIQDGYKVEPLSAFLGTKAPSKAVAIDFPEVGRRSRV
jgi:hypothetical protein